MSMLRLRCALSHSVSFPKFLPFLPNPAFLLRFPAKLCSRSCSRPLYVHKSDYDDVALFIRMLHMRDTPPIFEFNKILESLVKKRYHPTVISLCRRLEFRGITPDIFTYNLCINCYSHLGQIASAFSVIGKMIKRSYQPDTMTLKMFIKGLWLRDEIIKAKHVFNTMTQRGVTPDLESYGLLIMGFSNIQMFDEAMKFRGEMYSKRIIPYQEYAYLIDLCKSGRISDALEFVDEMRYRGIPDNVISYSYLVDTLCNSDHVDQAIALVRKIIDQGIEPELPTYTTLIGGLCKAGRPKDAQEIFLGLLAEGCKLTVVAYSIMIDELCKEGMIDETVALLSKMEDNGWINAITFQLIINSLPRKHKDHNDNVKKLLHEVNARGLLRE